MNILITMFGGIIASIMAIIIWEWVQQPELFIEYYGRHGSYYRMNVNNYGGRPAYNCKIKMKFTDYYDDSDIFNDKINGKWDSKPHIAHIQNRNVRMFFLHYIEKTDIHVNMSETFSLLIRNNDNVYPFSSSFDINPQFLLDNNIRYKVKIILHYSGKTKKYIFSLQLNRGNIQIEEIM